MRNPFVVCPGERPHPVQAVVSYLVVCALIVGFFWVSLVQVGVALDFSFIGQYQVRILDGLLLTLQIAAGSLVVSLVIGLPVAVGQGSRVLPVRYLCDVYVKLMRGTPLLAQIYLFFYIVGTAWGVENRLVAGIIILSIFSGAYIAEIVRGSLNSLDAGQLEAARAVGFTRQQALRYVVVPQLVSRTLPALTGQLASMVKDSSLLSVIAVIELTQTMQEISAATFNLFGTYLFLAGAYFCLTLPIMFVSRYFERRLDYAHAA
ncbi:MAG TPA: amino acid ABC transporter permease [Candidatus Limicola stercorigallinarum]|nr:amino acid ABC transporter permease [Candidatus Limicola stercorigallinarum]